MGWYICACCSGFSVSRCSRCSPRQRLRAYITLFEVPDLWKEISLLQNELTGVPRPPNFLVIGGSTKSLAKASCLSLNTMLKSMLGSLLPLPLVIEQLFRKTDGCGSLMLASLHRTLIYFRLRQIDWPHCTGMDISACRQDLLSRLPNRDL